MNALGSVQKNLFDIRPGEHLRTWSMFLYLLCVLFAYYILKPVSRSMFLTQFDADKLPWLYILIAGFGGLFAYLYSRLATRTSLRTAVFWTMSISVAALCAIWLLIGLPWMVYVLNIFVSLFSIVLVSQGWLVASNIFDAREAKRLYPLLGVGMVLGAALGGEFTHLTALLLGTRNLLLASAAMVILAYLAYRLSISRSGSAVKAARAGDEHETDFSFGGMVKDVVRIRHLQVIVGIMISMYLVDTLVDFQFQALASRTLHGDHLTAFFGQFYGLYLNATELVFQLFLTSQIVKRFGVGGTLKISPVAVALASVATVAAPGTLTAGAARLTEASTRYTVNRTGIELLYMPLPQGLRNRVKAFIDICLDRTSRGLGGVLLLLLTATSLRLGARGIAVVVMILCVPWTYLSYLASREYVSTIRKRFESRRLDLENARISVNDTATVRMLESTAAGENPRQAVYALSLLADAAAYDLRPLLRKLAGAAALDVRAKVYELAVSLGDSSLLEEARAEASRPDSAAIPAVSYLVRFSPDRERITAALLEDPDPLRARGAVEALRSDPDLAARLLTREWLSRAARSEDPARREIAALAIGVRGDHGTEALYSLLTDPDLEVARQACDSAGALGNRAYLFSLIDALANPKLRGAAVAALARYGPAICGTLSDLLADEAQPPAARRQAPRVLKRIPDQRSVDVLLAASGHQDLSTRAAVLKALNHLQGVRPQPEFRRRLRYGADPAGGPPLLRAQRRPVAVSREPERPAERDRAAGPHHRGEAEEHAGAAVPAAGAALSAQRNLCRLAGRFEPAAGAGHRRAGVSGKHHGPQPQTVSAAPAGRTGESAGARPRAFRRRTADRRRRHPRPDSFARPLAGGLRHFGRRRIEAAQPCPGDCGSCRGSANGSCRSSPPRRGGPGRLSEE